MILITGLTGCLGRELSYQLQKAGHVVINVPRFDLSNREATRSAIRDLVEKNFKPKAIFHCAALTELAVTEHDALRTAQVNELGTIHLLESLMEFKISPYFCHVSTSHVYQSQLEPHRLIESDLLAPRSIYATSKAGAENWAKVLSKKFSFPLFLPRVFSYIAPWQSQAFVAPRLAELVRRARSGETIQSGWLGAQRDFLEVTDVARALLLAYEKQIEGIYNICHGQPVAIRNLLDTFISIRRTLEPGFELYVNEGKPRDDDIRWLIGSPEEFTKVTGFRPNIELSEGLNRLWNYQQQKSTGNEI